MGRKKKGECSREAILKQVDLACKDNELDQESKMKKKTAKRKQKKLIVYNLSLIALLRLRLHMVMRLLMKFLIKTVLNMKMISWN